MVGGSLRAGARRSPLTLQQKVGRGRHERVMEEATGGGRRGKGRLSGGTEYWLTIQDSRVLSLEPRHWEEARGAANQISPLGAGRVR